jgi:hypothetical protein
MRAFTRRAKDDVDFTTFMAVIDAPFDVKLNDEHDAYTWTDKYFAMTSRDLHPGLVVTLLRFDMDELAVAKAMASGELVSPQMYNKDLMLIALRITGTGVSFRPAHDEYVMRDPSIYMNQEFLERCNGLEVLLHHPKKSLLNTEEYRDRAIGSIFVPYLKPDEQEVWGIARIRDMEAAEILRTEECSTSPGVSVLGDKLEVPDGRKILIEDKPFLLDHLAVLIPHHSGEGSPGVWDKGKGLSGVESIDATSQEDEVNILDLLERKLKIIQLDSRVR